MENNKKHEINFIKQIIPSEIKVFHQIKKYFKKKILIRNKRLFNNNKYSLKIKFKRKITLILNKQKLQNSL
jgi:hypothetical protein